ncbi:MAG: hypothetical protein LBT51_03585 [Fusobacteriaceae bacterium]|jgi:hypothetical protein|nr:hypothetical protein [Fusobacteriaceae bacterium]
MRKIFKTEYTNLKNYINENTIITLEEVLEIYSNKGVFDIKNNNNSNESLYKILEIEKWKGNISINRTC